MFCDARECVTIGGILLFVYSGWTGYRSIVHIWDLFVFCSLFLPFPPSILLLVDRIFFFPFHFMCYLPSAPHA